MFLLVFGRHVGAHPDGHQHVNLYKLGKTISPLILHNKNCCDLNLGESFCIITFFLLPDSGLLLLDGFDFYLIYFEWRDTENQQLASSCLESFLAEFNLPFFVFLAERNRLPVKGKSYLLKKILWLRALGSYVMSGKTNRWARSMLSIN